ncbi:MAG: Na+/H+ antiporter NhaA [Bacteroidaceae bacterium]|nr:Na+/H+ antiporter NhaA [Bacteroidaceae bacterium]
MLSFNRRSERLSQQPWAQGVLLLFCVIAAMLLANLPATKFFYHSFLETKVQIHFMSPDGNVDWLFPRDLTIEKFINDVLMVVFFFTVGLEIKREVAHGELSSLKKALLPIIAAFGGVIMPAVIFTLVNHGTPAASGWGIPTATDIAFAVCILSVLGDRVPVSLKVFLTALAIADDLIAILVVALFYGGHINLLLLGISLAVIGIALLLRHLGQKHVSVYLALAVVVWVLFYYSGIHATMSGVVMAFIIPSTPRYERPYVLHKIRFFADKLVRYDRIDDDTDFPNGPQRHFLRRIQDTAYGSMNMSYRVEHALSPWVNFLIMPIFALANAGVEIPDISFFNIFNTAGITGGVGLGIFLGLVLGKPLGITLFSFIAVKTGICTMPDKAGWKMFFAVACLGGIGFTMSIFVDTLSFADAAAVVAMRNAGKIAILLGSIAAGIIGTVLIRLASVKRS